MSQLERRIAVARGEEPADLVLKGGRHVNVLSGEIEEAELTVAEVHAAIHRVQERIAQPFPEVNRVFIEVAMPGEAPEI